MSKSTYLEDRLSQAKRDVGKWMATATGWFWFLEDPDPRDVHIVDVAYGLARQSRYGGQFGVHVNDYSVSEHSRLMDQFLSENAPKRMAASGQSMMMEDRLTVLLHDTPEHLFGDMITPVKSQFPSYKGFEKLHENAVMASFIIVPDGVMVSKTEIKEIDIRIRADEREAIILDPAKTIGRERLPWVDDANGVVVPLGVEIVGNMSPFEARLFLEAFIDIVENVPARLPENGPERNSSLRRHYVEACQHIGREPAFDPKTGVRVIESPEPLDGEENSSAKAEEFASRLLLQAKELGPETLASLKMMIEAEMERSDDYEPVA